MGRFTFLKVFLLSFVEYIKKNLMSINIGCIGDQQKNL